MDERNLMVLWRDDLRRTGYGSRNDPNPPASRLPNCYEFDNPRQLNTKGRMFRARVCARLQQRGYMLKETAYMTSIHHEEVHSLLRLVWAQGAK